MSVSWSTGSPIRSFIPKVRKEAASRARNLALLVFEGAVTRTPVGSGELRASWNVSLGSPNYDVVGSVDSSPGPTGILIPPPSAPSLPIPFLRNARYFISNGKRYAPYVEYGSMTITPRLMLTRAVRAAGR